MLTDDERRRGAQELFRAEREREVIPQLSRTFPGIELADAYDICACGPRRASPRAPGSWATRSA
jgi:2-keto-4-pentenoate hydratase